MFSVALVSCMYWCLDECSTTIFWCSSLHMRRDMVALLLSPEMSAGIQGRAVLKLG